MDSSVKKMIEESLNHLSEQFVIWNNLLQADSRKHPAKSAIKVVQAFEVFFSEMSILDSGDQEAVIKRVMDFYGGNYLYDLYGPKPSREFDAETLNRYQIAGEIVDDYIHNFPSLRNPESEELLDAILQDLEFGKTMQDYFSRYWIKGQYKINADFQIYKLVEFCLKGESKITKIYASTEVLWATVYGERQASKPGARIKTACSRGRKIKQSPKFVLNKSVSRYGSKTYTS
jgi:hypothetical protein